MLWKRSRFFITTRSPCEYPGECVQFVSTSQPGRRPSLNEARYVLLFRWLADDTVGRRHLYSINFSWSTSHPRSLHSTYTYYYVTRLLIAALRHFFCPLIYVSIRLSTPFQTTHKALHIRNVCISIITLSRSRIHVTRFDWSVVVAARVWGEGWMGGWYKKRTDIDVTYLTWGGWRVTALLKGIRPAAWWC